MQWTDRQDEASGALGRRLADAMRGEAPPPVTAEMDTLTDALLQDAVAARASDIHIDPQRGDVSLRFRIDGAMVDVMSLTFETSRRIVNQLKARAKVDPVMLFAPEESRLSFSLDGENVDLRVAFAPGIAGEKITIRLLSARRLHRDIRDLGLSGEMVAHVESWLGNVNGMFLTTGPTGSGKTTTLYALLHQLRLLDRNIMTLEDPIEYQIDRITQLQVDKAHDLTFQTGVKAMLRHDPDFLLLGEIRDRDSAQSAVAAASSGRVLLSTLHSHDPVSAISTLRNWGLADHEITAAVQVILAQRLVRRLCVACRREGPMASDEERWLRAVGEQPIDSVWHAVGCEECQGTGYRGRVGVFEIWRLLEHDLDQISRHAAEGTLRRHMAKRGHRVLLDDGLAKVRAGLTSISELIRGRLMPRRSTDREKPLTASKNRSAAARVSTRETPSPEPSNA